MKPDRIRQKDAAYTSAWARRFLYPPSLRNRVLAAAVYIHETAGGDAWPGPDGVLDTADDERNWGATTLRELNVAEVDAVHKAGVTPTVGPGHEKAARAAQAAIVAAGLPLPAGTIHCDSSPIKGPYFVWFANFATDIEGADYFIRLLCLRKDGTHKPAYDELTSDKGAEQSLARAMYNAGYFTGFVKPKPPGGPQEKAKAAAANIDAYAHALRMLTPTIRLALTGGEPPKLRPVIRRGSSGPVVQEWQRAVGVIADGVFGPVTEMATKNWQRQHGLVQDGIVGPATWSEHDKSPTDPNLAAVRDE